MGEDPGSFRSDSGAGWIAGGASPVHTRAARSRARRAATNAHV